MEEILHSDQNFKITLIYKTKHLICLQWLYQKSDDNSLTNPDADDRVLFRLKKKELRNWVTAFWGTDAKCLFIDLEQNICLNFILERVYFDGNNVSIASNCAFKTCTLPDIPTATSFFRAVKKGQVLVLRKMLSSKSDLVHVYTSNGQTPLALAATVNSDDEETCRILLEAGANIYNGCRYTKKTPLQIAIYYGNLNIAKYLLDKKTNIHTMDGIGLTAAHYAVDSNNLKGLKLCIKYGGNIETKDRSGYTLIQRAIVMNSDLDIIKYLLSHSSNWKTVNDNQLNCIDLARIYGRDDVLKILDPPKKRLLAAGRSVKHRHLFSSVINLIKCTNN